MELKIEENGEVGNGSLEARAEGVLFYADRNESTTRHELPYAQIDSVLLSSDHQLSLQSGENVFSLYMRPDNEQHRHTIKILLNELKRDRPVPTSLAF